jgi:hypothetical protein
MVVSHGQSLSHSGGNVRKKKLTWLSHKGKVYLKLGKMEKKNVLPRCMISCNFDENFANKLL